MTNDININNALHGTRVSTSAKSQVEHKDGNTAGKTETSQPAESVSVSSQLNRLGELSKKLADMPAVDSTRVAEIKQALADGSLKMDAEKIADALMQFESSYFETNGK